MFGSIKRLFAKRSFTSAEPGFLSAVNTASGVSMNERRALSIPAYYQGIRLYANVIASLNFNVYQLLERGRQCATAHPLWRLLHDEPNEFQTAFTFRQTMTAHMIGWGNAFAYIERDDNFRPIGLLPLLPDRTYAQRINGELKYHTRVNGNLIALEPYEVLALPGFGFDGVSGYSPVRLMRQSLGLTVAASEFGAKFFGSGANMGGVLSHPGTLSPAAQTNLKDQIEDKYVGNSNAFKIMLLMEGMKFEKFGVPPEDAQFLETRQFQNTEIAQMLGLPPHLIYDLSRSTNNNIEQQSIEAVRYSFTPVAKVWEQECNRKLLFEDEKNAFECEFDFTDLLRGDSVARASYYQNQYNTGSMTPNEIREAEGRNPIAGGDELFINSTMLPLSQAIQKAVADSMAALGGAGVDTAQAAQKLDEIAEDPAEELTETPGQEAAEDQADKGQAPNPPIKLTPGPIKDSDGQPGPKIDAKLVQDTYGGAGSIGYTGWREMVRPVVKDAIGRILKREIKLVQGAIKRNAFNYEDDHRRYILEALTPVAAMLKATGNAIDTTGYAERHLETSRQSVALITSGKASANELETDWATDRVTAATDQILGGDV
jgi:HK97 family phage portal protein